MDLDKFFEELKGIQPGDKSKPVPCPSCGQIHELEGIEISDEEPPQAVKDILAKLKKTTGKTLEGINVVDVARDAAKMLNNDSIPVDHKIPMIASFMGTFAENISAETWAKILAKPPEPCSEEDCDCHLVMAKFLPALYELKLAAIRNGGKEEE
jgi:hypothetical protein